MAGGTAQQDYGFEAWQLSFDNYGFEDKGFEDKGFEDKAGSCLQQLLGRTLLPQAGMLSTPISQVVELTATDTRPPQYFNLLHAR